MCEKCKELVMCPVGEKRRVNVEYPDKSEITDFYGKKLFIEPWTMFVDKYPDGHNESEAGVKSVTDNNVGGKMTSTDKDTNVPSKWIPVTDRLPEIPDDWAEHPDPVLYMMKTTKTIYAGYYGENGTYRDRYFRQYHDRYEGVDADDVLCWMWQHDLPEPPKGE